MKPLQAITDLITNRPDDIQSWFAKAWQGLTPLPYFSCDIRHANYKFGVVDTNLFPAGFNNLCNAFTKKTAEAIKNYFSSYYPNAKNIALLAENHTRNKFYLLNILKIKTLLEQAGLKCQVTMPLDHFPTNPLKIDLTDTETLEIYKPGFSQSRKVAESQSLQVKPAFIPDLILSNNDFSSGVPKQFEGLEDIIIPNPKLGWHKRSKGTHFKHLSQVICSFSKEFSLDPWLLCPLVESIEGVHADNCEQLAELVDQMIKDIKRKYEEYEISEAPYVFIKNDSGTYGLGLISVSSGEEVLKLNRKRRNKLFSTKGDVKSEKFLIQEGIPTADTYSGFPLEPVIYGIGKDSIGGFFRLHEGKNPYESLNAPGMSFSCLCLHKLDEPHESDFIDCKSKDELVKGSLFLAKLAALAAAKESI